MAVSAGSLQNRSNLSIPSSGVVGDLGQALPGLGVASNRVGNGLGVDEESLLVKVVDVLLNDICKFLRLSVSRGKTTGIQQSYADLHGSVVEKGLPFRDCKTSGAVQKGDR